MPHHFGAAIENLYVRPFDAATGRVPCYHGPDAGYTDKLGFRKKTDARRRPSLLTSSPRSNRMASRLLLEPDDHPAARPSNEALVADGIPSTSFSVADARKEYERLQAAGVHVVQEPAEGPVVTAVLDDTCGNLIQIASIGSSN